MSFVKFKDEKESTNLPSSESPKIVDFVKNQPRSATSQLAAGTKIVGKIFFDGVAEINGDIEGEVVSRGVLTIGSSATLKAKVTGQEVTILGLVQGDIEATERLVLRKPARVLGNIKTPALSMEEGVVFQGGCRMDPKSGCATE